MQRHSRAAHGARPGGGKGTVGRIIRLVTYQAMCSNPATVARVRAAQRAIEQVGEKVHIAPPTKVGMVVILLYLPEGYAPDQFLPGLPFYQL